MKYFFAVLLITICQREISGFVVSSKNGKVIKQVNKIPDLRSESRTTSLMMIPSFGGGREREISKQDQKKRRMNFPKIVCRRTLKSRLQSTDSSSTSLWTKVFSTLVQTTTFGTSSLTTPALAEIKTDQDRLAVQMVTLLRVGVPSLLAGFIGTFAFPGIALFLATIMNDAGVFAVLSQDSSQFVQNFLTVTGLLFSILVGQTYYFMYQQQEAIYYALFNEVTEAKSLLEQVALVCQGRSMYQNVLSSISKYVQYDLKQLQADPAVLLSSRPIDDPLESIMYMTSVGVPSSVYETVRSLRQARAGRLGALQRKLPYVHMLLLWLLALIELVSFPLLGAGTQTIGGYNILTVEGCLFGVMVSGIVMTLRVVGELWRPAGGAYNVDGVLGIMVRGLEEELQARQSGSATYVANKQQPSPQFDPIVLTSNDSTKATDSTQIKHQGFSFSFVLFTVFKQVMKYFRRI